MLSNFDELITRVRSGRQYRVCVAAAQDEELLSAVKLASDMGFLFPVLVGPEDEIRDLTEKVGLDECEIIACDETETCAGKAVEIVRSGKADVLMKGVINTAIYMRAILNRQKGLRNGSLISALAAYDLKEYHKLIFCSDSGINTSPDLEQKRQILVNALGAMKRLGMDCPNVAALTANEMVHPKIQATVDADALVTMSRNRELPDCVIEGPIAFDVAFDRHAAEHKGIDSRISGEVDLILAPNIETGNALGKSWLTLSKAKWAGVVLGTTHPVVLGSRSDTAEVKINSIALACLLAQS
ncbi:phosphate acyltransferase [Pseudodesulfovibrio tunisiensis]|uniref:phosphate acyltransferase n=1 Tax=Pseudodesulfovibrio tunisiensis TaxID=463192 RepID=UPI001FB2BC5D|nr:phosphate acyltransferase [Pseudodesulfovibrio tunisiensis]